MFASVYELKYLNLVYHGVLFTNSRDFNLKFKVKTEFCYCKLIKQFGGLAFFMHQSN